MIRYAAAHILEAVALVEVGPKKMIFFHVNLHQKLLAWFFALLGIL